MISPKAPPNDLGYFLRKTIQTHELCCLFEYEALLMNILYKKYDTGEHCLQLPYDRHYLENTRYEILFDYIDELLAKNCHHQYPMEFFDEKEIFSRPLANSQQQIEASGDVFVCTNCGRGHLCTKQECLSEKVCHYTGRCRSFNFFYTQQRRDQISGNLYDQSSPDLTINLMENIFGYKEFDAIRLYYTTRKQKKFAIIINEKDRDILYAQAQQVVNDLFIPVKKPNVAIIKKKRKFYQIDNDEINSYLLKCRAMKKFPIWMECVRLHHLTINKTITISIQQKNDICNLICNILFKILQTQVGKSQRFDNCKMFVAIIYCMATQGIIMESFVLIPKLDWMNQFLLDQQNLSSLYKKKYDKSCIIEGQNKYRGIIRHLITQYGYNYKDFAL